MNIPVTLKELVAIYAVQHSGAKKPSISNVIVHNIFLLSDISRAEAYLMGLFKEELSEVMDTGKDLKAWCSIMQTKIKVGIYQFNNVSKPITYRKYLQDLEKLDVLSFLKYLKPMHDTDEFLFISEAALKIKVSEKQIRNYMKKNLLEFRKNGANKTVISKKSVLAFIRGRS